ncbi:MAG TPA: Rrf2 family transcriptional regulator [Gemmataceae bacterium]|nr:Rrf2 family transcriptional regulator [Gemmataceae bacterium]
MKITAQEEYGLRCLLKVAGTPDGSSLTLPEIAAAEGLSVPYAAKLLSVLRHAGFLDSVRGRAGGYKLALPPEQIGLGSLLLALGEPLFDEPSYCEKHAGTADGVSSCVHLGGCSLRALWHTLEQWMRHSLDQITLADLMQTEFSLAELLRIKLGGTGPIESLPALLTLNPMPALASVE